MTTPAGKVEIKTITAIAPSHWGSYLTDGDRSTFDYSGDEADEQACYDMEKEIGGYCVGVEDIGFEPFPEYGGKAVDCARYTFIVS